MYCSTISLVAYTLEVTVSIFLEIAGNSFSIGTTFGARERILQLEKKTKDSDSKITTENHDTRGLELVGR